jgi:hypothetical protein
MSQKTDTVVACTIGIDTGKNTLHLIGLDDRGAHTNDLSGSTVDHRGIR